MHPSPLSPGAEGLKFKSNEVAVTLSTYGGSTELTVAAAAPVEPLVRAVSDTALPLAVTPTARIV